MRIINLIRRYDWLEFSYPDEISGYYPIDLGNTQFLAETSNLADQHRDIRSSISITK